VDLWVVITLHHEDGGDTFLRNVDHHLQVHTHHNPDDSNRQISLLIVLLGNMVLQEKFKIIAESLFRIKMTQVRKNLSCFILL
jgi:hypothetical protein